MTEVVLVTGAARGIGRAIADELVKDGYLVVRGDVLDAGSWEDSLADAGSQRLSLDVTNAASCANFVAAAQRWGSLVGLVNNAGIVRRGPAEDVDLAELQQVMDVNLSGSLRMCQAVFPMLKDHGQGSIVNLGSTNGFVAVPNTLAYCLSKAAVMHMTKVLALEWAPKGIRVNAVAPTIVPTAMTSDVRSDSQYMEEKLASIPLNRMASLEDVAGTVAFLMSGRASMITGQSIFVDGGVVLR